MASIDPHAAAMFADLLGGAVDAPHTWQAFDDTPARDHRKARVWHGTLRQHGGELYGANLAGCGIYVTVNRTDLAGRKRHNVQVVRALFVDCDRVSPERWHVEPSVIVQSVAGPHAYWFVNDCPLEAFSAAQKRLAAFYGSDPVIHDLPRVMRVPGFLHCKAEPRPVQLVQAVGCTYSTAEVLDGVPELPAAGPAPWQPAVPLRRAARWREVEAVRVFRDAGHYGREVALGKHSVICPWINEHTVKDFSGLTADTVLWETSTDGAAVFHCAHAHCRDRYLVHALAALCGVG